jgi:hypothetical protein
MTVWMSGSPWSIASMTIDATCSRSNFRRAGMPSHRPGLHENVQAIELLSPSRVVLEQSVGGLLRQ